MQENRKFGLLFGELLRSCVVVAKMCDVYIGLPVRK